jgi:hypothetical protein
VLPARYASGVPSGKTDLPFCRYYNEKQKKMKKLPAVFFLLLLSGACTTVQVKQVSPAPGFALTQYQTFGFYEISTQGEAADQPYIHQVGLLKTAIQHQLSAKGLRHAPANPDLLVNIGVVTTEKVQTRQTDFRTDAPRYIGQRRYSWKSEEVEVGRYKQGTVTVDLVDRERNARVWQGTVESIIPRQEARQQKTIAAGMAQLFEKL